MSVYITTRFLAFRSNILTNTYPSTFLLLMCGKAVGSLLGSVWKLSNRTFREIPPELQQKEGYEHFWQCPLTNMSMISRLEVAIMIRCSESLLGRVPKTFEMAPHFSPQVCRIFRNRSDCGTLRKQTAHVDGWLLRRLTKRDANSKRTAYTLCHELDFKEIFKNRTRSW